MRRAAIHTVGCRLNHTESHLLQDRLRQDGYRIVDFSAPADLGIINTCTVTRAADAKCRQAIRGFIRRNPAAFTAVIGCYAQTAAAAIAAIPGVDLIAGNQDKLEVAGYARLGKNPRPLILRDRIVRTDFSIAFVGDQPYDKRANLKVQDGCDFLCSFCVIPFARGRARARDWANTLAEARAAAARGIRELVLTGVNIGTYASAGRNLTDLVDALAAIPGLLRLRISSIEPTTVDPALLDRMADPGHILQPHLHLPLQSGSDRVLAAMRRRYSLAEYTDCVRAAADRVPDLCIGTDLLAGFPGESDADFAATCACLADLPFAYAHVFPYSERPGTLTAQRPADDVPPGQRASRCRQLRSISARQQHAFMAARLGREVAVLLEDPDREGLFPGYTPDYVRVRVAAPAGADLRNQLVRVRLERIRGDFIQGSLLAAETR